MKEQDWNLDMACYTCGGNDHIAVDCYLRLPAQNDKEHGDRIKALIDNWVDGRISTQRKRQLIAGENRFYYGEGCRPELTRLD